MVRHGKIRLRYLMLPKNSEFFRSGTMQSAGCSWFVRSGKIIFDKSKPDGTPQKLLDVGRINNLGWKFQCDLDRGLKICYKDYLNRFFKK